MRRAGLIGILLLVVAGCSHFSGQTPFVMPGPSDLSAVLPPPPSASSQEATAEMDLVLRLQETRNAEDEKRVKSEIDDSVFAFADVLGAHFNAKECPQSSKLFSKVVAEVKPVSSAAKEQWRRPRPLADARVHALDKEKSFSYPSGHSTRASAYAELLAQIMPAKREALFERGRQIGWDRVIAGVHFPSDVYAGRVLGHAIAQAMLRDPAIRRDLTEVAQEIHHVCGVETGPMSAKIPTTQRANATSAPAMAN